MFNNIESSIKTPKNINSCVWPNKYRYKNHWLKTVTVKIKKNQHPIFAEMVDRAKKIYTLPVNTLHFIKSKRTARELINKYKTHSDKFNKYGDNRKIRSDGNHTKTLVLEFLIKNMNTRTYNKYGLTPYEINDPSIYNIMQGTQSGYDAVSKALVKLTDDKIINTKFNYDKNYKGEIRQQHAQRWININFLKLIGCYKKVKLLLTKDKPSQKINDETIRDNLSGLEHIKKIRKQLDKKHNTRQAKKRPDN